MITNKRILILGGTGSLGHALVKFFLERNILAVFSRDENKQWAMRSEFPTISYYLGDVRSKLSIDKTLISFKPDYVIFAAALKHIDICEKNVSECIETNVIGLRNAINSCLSSDVNSFLFVSTDKACNPINTYGQSKALGEKLITEASSSGAKCRFLCVRYGNIINSRGSLIPLYKDIASNDERKFFPVTSESMTRFFMTLKEAFELIETALINGKSGDIWIRVAISLKVMEIAKYFSEKYNKPIKIIGIRPGEKIHEDIYSIFEEPRLKSFDFNGNTFQVYNNQHEYRQDESFKGHSSSNVLVRSEIQQFISSLVES